MMIVSHKREMKENGVLLRVVMMKTVTEPSDDDDGDYHSCQLKRNDENEEGGIERYVMIGSEDGGMGWEWVEEKANYLRV